MNDKPLAFTADDHAEVAARVRDRLHDRFGQPRPSSQEHPVEDRWIVVIVAPDGTISATGPRPHNEWNEYEATLWANAHENDETGWTCYPVVLEVPAAQGKH